MLKAFSENKEVQAFVKYFHDKGKNVKASCDEELFCAEKIELRLQYTVHSPVDIDIIKEKLTSAEILTNLNNLDRLMQKRLFFA